MKKFLKNKLVLLSIASIGAKLFALIRDMLFASVFGASITSASFEGANGIPPAVFELFFGCAIGSAFIPILCRAEREDSKAGASDFANSFSGIVLALSALLSALGIFFSGRILSLFAHGISEAPSSKALLCLLFPTLFLNSFSYIIIAILHFKGSFVFPALIPIFPNALSIIYLLSGLKDIYGYAFVSLFASALQLIALYKYLRSKNFILQPKLRKNKNIKDMIGLTFFGFLPCAMMPVISLLSLYYSDLFFEGRGISLYNYAHRIFLMAGGFFAFVFSAVLLPAFSRLEAGEEKGEAKKAFIKHALILLIILTPVTIGCTVFPREIVSIIFMRGNFSFEDTKECASILRLLGLGIPSFALSEIALKLYFARRKCLFPSLCALLSLLLFTIFIFIKRNGEGLKALALANTICYAIYSILLLAGLKLLGKGSAKNG